MSSLSCTDASEIGSNTKRTNALGPESFGKLTSALEPELPWIKLPPQCPWFGNDWVGPVCDSSKSGGMVPCNIVLSHSGLSMLFSIVTGILPIAILFSLNVNISIQKI